MTEYAPDDLFSILDAFEPVLNSIEIKTVAVHLPSEPDFRNLITTIIISDKTVEAIKTEHKHVPKIENNQFRIFYQVLPFENRIFEEISDGIIRFIDRIGFYIVRTRPFDLLALKLSSRRKCINGVCGSVLMSNASGVEEDRKKLWDVVMAQNNLAKKFSFSEIQELIRDCLKTEFDNGDTKDFEISINPFAIIQEISVSNNQIIVNVQIPKNITGLQINLQVKRNYQVIWRDAKQIESKSNLLRFQINNLIPLDTVCLELFHVTSGLTFDEAYHEIPLENVVDPFLKTLGAFCSIDEFKEMLLEPGQTKGKPQYNFETAVSWLLSLSGFNVIHLNSSGKSFDKLRIGEGFEKGCADIIAYEENERLLLIDCDTSVVDEKKVQKLAQTKKYLRETLKGYEKLHIVPILFTPIESTFGHSSDVTIADREIIKKIFDAVIKGDRLDACEPLRLYGL